MSLLSRYFKRVEEAKALTHSNPNLYNIGETINYSVLIHNEDEAKVAAEELAQLASVPTLDKFQEEAMRTDGDDTHYLNSGLNDNRVKALLGCLTKVMDIAEDVDSLKKRSVYTVREGEPSNYTPRWMRHTHAMAGIVSELPEIEEAFMADDRVGLAEEIGDILWYVALLGRAHGISLSEAANSMLAKLRIRFPDKFNVDGAVNRQLTAERDVMEKLRGE